MTFGSRHAVNTPIGSFADCLPMRLEVVQDIGPVAAIDLELARAVGPVAYQDLFSRGSLQFALARGRELR